MVIVSGVTGGSAAGGSEGPAMSGGSVILNDGRVPLAGLKMGTESVQSVLTSVTGMLTHLVEKGPQDGWGGRPLKDQGGWDCKKFPSGPRTSVPTREGLL